MCSKDLKQAETCNMQQNERKCELREMRVQI